MGAARGSGQPRPDTDPVRGISVELPLWRALALFRLLTLGYGLLRYLAVFPQYAHPAAGWTFMAVLAAWTLATTRSFASAAPCPRPLLAADMLVGVTGIVLTRFFDDPQRVLHGAATMPTIWAAGPVLGFAARGGWRPAALAAGVVGAADIVERGAVTAVNLHNIVLLTVAGCVMGYAVGLARRGEAALARALQLEAATTERERLARSIHDGVLQVLAMVQRRGREAGGEAAELGRMAGDQEAALRALVSGVLLPDREYPAGPVPPAAGYAPPPPGPDPAPLHDLRALLGQYADARVTVSGPGTPVLLPRHAAAEVAAAVAAALDNVRRHAGAAARAWILLEDEPAEVVVSIRDDGPGIPPGRLEDAEREGRLGVSQSIRGRLRGLGGSVEVGSGTGQGTELELRIPRPRRAGQPAGPRAGNGGWGGLRRPERKDEPR